MKKVTSVKLIFINEYIYQIQNRLNKFEKKEQQLINKKTQLLFSQSWSLKTASLNNKKKDKQKSIYILKLEPLNIINLKNLQSLHIYNKNMQNFIYLLNYTKEFLMDELCLELKLKKYFTNKKIKRDGNNYGIYRSNFFLIKNVLKKTLVCSLLIYEIEQIFYYYIKKNYYKICLKLFSNFSKPLNFLILAGKLIYNKKNQFILSSKGKTVESSIQHLIHDFQPRFIFPNIDSDLLFWEGNLQNYNNFIVNLSIEILPVYYKAKEGFDSTCFYIKTIKRNVFFVGNSKYRFSKLYSKIFKSINYLEEGKRHFLDTKLKNQHILFSLDKVLTILELNNFLIYLLILKPKAENIFSDNIYSDRFKVSKYNAIKYLIKTLQTRPKYFIHFLIFNHYNFFTLNNNQLNKPFKLQSSINVNVPAKNDANRFIFDVLANKKQTFSNHISKLVLVTLNLNSLLFEYLVTNNLINSLNFDLSSLFKKKIYSNILELENLLINCSTQKLEMIKKLYYYKTKIKEQKNINLLFVNILFSQLEVRVKSYVLLKNIKKNFLSLNSLSIEVKKISTLFKIQSKGDDLSYSYSLNLYPHFILYKNQFLFLTDDLTMIKDCLVILKKFLYFQLFNLRLTKVKVGHTLLNYKQNIPGVDFLGFFICDTQTKISEKRKLPSTFIRNASGSYFSRTEKIIRHKKNKNSCSVFTNQSNIQTLLSQYSLSHIGKDKLISDKTEKKCIKTERNFNLISTNNTIILNPSKNQIKLYFKELKTIIKTANSSNQETLILKLSFPIRIWVYYYKIILNKQILKYCDYLLFKLLWRWCCRRHPNKNKKWIKYKYFQKINGKTWVFAVYNFNKSSIICLPNHTDLNLIY